MFWDVFQTRINLNHSQGVAAPRRPSAPMHHPGMPFSTAGFPQSRPPHAPSPQPPGLSQSQAQSQAALASRSRAVAAASSRNSGPPSPYVSMDNPMGFALPAESGTPVPNNGVMGALGDIISPPAGHGVSAMEMANMPGGMRTSSQMHMRGAHAGQGHNPQGAAAAMAYAAADKRLSAQEAYTLANRRAGSNNPNAHMGVNNFNEEESAAIAARRAQAQAAASMTNSKKRASVESPLPQAGSPSSASMVPGGYPKMAPNGPKKRLRASASYNSGLQGEMEALQQSQQIARGSSLPLGSPHPQAFPQANPQSRQGYTDLMRQQMIMQRRAQAAQQSHDLGSMQAQNAAVIAAQRQKVSKNPPAPPPHGPMMAQNGGGDAGKTADQLDLESILETPSATGGDAYMLEMANGNHRGIPTSRAAAPARRASYPRTKNGAAAIRQGITPASVSQDALTGAPPGGQDGRRGGAQALGYSVANERAGKDNSSQRSGMYAREVGQPAGGNGNRENGYARPAGRKGVGAAQAGISSASISAFEALEENMSTKSERPPANGPGTPSQRSAASGGSCERRAPKQTGATRRRSAGRGRRGRADRTVGTVSPTAAAARRAGAAAAETAAGAGGTVGARQSPKGKAMAAEMQRTAGGTPKAPKAPARNGGKKRGAAKGAKVTKKQAQAAQVQAQAAQAAQAQVQAHAQAQAQLQPPAPPPPGGPKRHPPPPPPTTKAAASKSKGATTTAAAAAQASMALPPAAVPAKRTKRASKAAAAKAQRELAAATAAVAANGKMEETTAGVYARGLVEGSPSTMANNHDIFDPSLVGLPDFSGNGAQAMFVPGEDMADLDFLPDFENFPSQ